MLSSKRPSVGLALGGGGIKGVIHIGILDIFTQHQIPIDIIAGSSAGGMIAGLYGAGLTASELEQLALELQAGKHFDFKLDLLRLIRLLFKVVIAKFCFGRVEMPKGIIDGRELEEFLFCQTSCKFFDQTKIPIAITATDIKSGNLIIFTEHSLTPSLQGLDNLNQQLGLHQQDNIFITDQYLARAIRASVAIPGFFTPVEINNRLLVDGGLKDNVPADILDQLGVDVKIAVDLEFEIQDDQSIKNPIDILLQSYDIMGQEVSDLKLDSYADLVLRPEVGKISLTDTDKIPYLLEVGRRVGLNSVSKIKALIAEY
ncbi:MAG: patatin-like phospholipase family protein [Bacillota bacterium]